MRHLALPALGLALLLLPAPPALAAEADCSSLSDFPCTYQLEEHAIRPAPQLLKLQARVAQGGMPIGQAAFPKMTVQLWSGNALVCFELFEDVEIRGSVINLVLGHEMSCELGTVAGKLSDLHLRLCPGGMQCLPKMPMRATPHAVRATWSWFAQRAHRASRAAQAHYAHRFTADRDLDEREILGTGYFDTETPGPAAIGDLLPDDVAADPEAAASHPYADGGYLLWTPIRNREAKSLTVSGKEHAGDTLRHLDRLVLHSGETRTTGDLRVEDLGDVGLTVEGGGAHVTGDLDTGGDLSVGGDLGLAGSWQADASAGVGGDLEVAAGASVTAGGLTLGGASDVDGPLSVAGSVTAAAGADVTGDMTVSGDLSVTAPGTGGAALEVSGDAQVLGGAEAGSLDVAGDVTAGGALAAQTLEVSGGAGVASLDVTGSLAVAGPVVFSGPVTFLGGISAPDTGADMTYVQYEDEVRDLTFGGLMTFAGGATAAADLALGYQLLQSSRLELADGPPGPCDDAAQGRIYLDLSDRVVRQCASGAWHALAGGADIVSACGNGYVQDGEACDDGDLEPGDGCDAGCAVEPGWACTAAGCAPVCGDGEQIGPEACDDGDAEDGDGCSAACQVEPGWTCQGTPSACEVPCGDGFVTGDEGCDDGGEAPGDGCDASCQVEAGWYCADTVPSLCEPVPLTVSGYAGAAGPDLTQQGLTLCAGAGPGDQAVSGVEWLLPCEGYQQVAFACSTGDDTTPELLSPAFPLAGVELTDAVCDDWAGAAITPVGGDLVLAVDAAGDPDCGGGAMTQEMYVIFGALWACMGEDITPGMVGQTGGRLWAYVRLP